MLWKISDVEKHKKGLSAERKSKWLNVANSTFKTCKAKGESDCDAKAIKIANTKCSANDSDVNDYINSISTINFSTSVKVKDIAKLETEQTDEGLLIKGLPVFRAGTYRGNEYSNDYIDRNLVGQFRTDEDIPVQADHDPSTFATLGWVQSLRRDSKDMLADFLLSDDNAIARWKKGLMKKFSIGIDIINDKLKEISIVAFPYVRSARVHSSVAEETLEDGNIEATEINGTYFVTIEGVQHKAEKRTNEKDEEFWFFFPFEARDENGDLKQFEETNISNEDIDNLDIKECSIDEVEVNASYQTPLPDSSFLILRKPVREKAKDRALPIKTIEGVLSVPQVKDALAKVDKVKNFSDSTVKEAKTKLNRISRKLGIEVEVQKHSNEDIDMKLDDLKKLDLSKLEGQGSELLREAVEHITRLEGEVATATTKYAEAETKIADLSKDAKVRKIDVEVDKLKSDGKIAPAQEVEIKAFMATLAEDKIDAFVKVLTDGKPKVDLGEAGETSEQEKDKDNKDKLDIDKLDATEVNDVAEKLAKDNEVEFQVALDWCYDGKVSKDGKLVA